MTQEPKPPSWRKRAARSPWLAPFLSLKVQVVCLFLLFVLVGWGTLDQAQHGLYAAQQRFFFSWVLFAGGWFPFPGAKLLLWILGLNLTATLVFRFAYTWSRLGLWLVHIGLLVLIAGAGITHAAGDEGFLTLAEGEGSDRLSRPRGWELSIWQKHPGAEVSREVRVTPWSDLRAGGLLTLPDGRTLRLVQKYDSAEPFIDPAATNDMVSPLGATAVQTRARAMDPSEDTPALLLEEVADRRGSGEGARLLLSALDPNPLYLAAGEAPICLSLRRETLALPAVLTLRRFIKEEHPGTDMARRFASRVTVETRGVARDTVISMNDPLRLGDWTFYQSGFQMEAGRKASVFAVTRNGGRILPYVATLLVFAGLVLHFGISVFSRLRRSS